MVREWSFPADSRTDTSGFMEHRSSGQGGRDPDRSRMNDNELSEALGIGVNNAHERIEDVTQHRTTDLSFED